MTSNDGGFLLGTWCVRPFISREMKTWLKRCVAMMMATFSSIAALRDPRKCISSMVMRVSGCIDDLVGGSFLSALATGDAFYRVRDEDAPAAFPGNEQCGGDFSLLPVFSSETYFQHKF